jgi:hypothetical protein
MYALVGAVLGIRSGAHWSLGAEVSPPSASGSADRLCSPLTSRTEDASFIATAEAANAIGEAADLGAAVRGDSGRPVRPRSDLSTLAAKEIQYSYAWPGPAAWKHYVVPAY